jgi:mono/diheme cytochrome c family protein
VRRASLLLVAVLAAAGCGGEDSPTQAGGATTSAEHPGLKVWAAVGCGSCHTLEAAGSTAEIGPNLDAALKTRDRAYIAQKIVSPTPGSIMPEDFGARLSDQELADLVAFIHESTR